VTALFSTLGSHGGARPGGQLGGAQAQGGASSEADRQHLKAGDTNTANIEKWEPSHLAEGGKGRRLHRGPARRARPLDHVKDGRIDNYQCVVPTTWNAVRATQAGKIGAFEASLMDTPVAKAEQPLEILRTRPQLRSRASPARRT
jgi:hydrogenase large subunit